MNADGSFPNFGTTTKQPPNRRILSGADFIGRHVPPVWLIDGIVQRSRLYACTSLTGHGKTAVWLFNACMIHAGRMIGQLDVFQGNVLFLAGENPADLEARMIGMARAYKLPLNRLPYVLPGSFPLTEAEADALKRDISGLGVPLALIVGDTASSFFPGDDENSNTQVGQYARTLRTFTECEGRPAVVVLSHPIKNASRSNLLPRGGGAFLNELDGNLALWSHSLGDVTELHWCGKIRGPDFAPFGYRLRPVPTGLTDEKDRPEVTIVAEPMSEEAVADHTKQTLANEDVVLRALRDHPDWSYAQIARDAGWIDGDDQPEKWKVQRAIRTLADDKLVAQVRRGAPWTLTEKGQEALATDTTPKTGNRPTEAKPAKPAAPEPPPPSESEINALIERIAEMSDAAFLALNRDGLAARLNCKPHEVAGLRKRAQAAAMAKASAEAREVKAAQAAARSEAGKRRKAAATPEKAQNDAD